MTTKFPVHLGNLTGPAGNAFAVIGAVSNAHRQCERAGVPNLPPLDEILAEMQSGDYENLLATVDKFCDDLDGSIENLADANWCDDDDDKEI